jgi:hypothetical protein
MIFLSHNSKDKPVVEQVALKLKEIYGQNNVFYDSWSIQPGDGIVDKMNEGLNNCKYFFFFISSNSLNSNMVKMEWQNALFKAAQKRIQFIPIRMDNSAMPTLLTQSLYIDLYAKGLDVVIRQIVDVISGTNTYREPQNQFSNLVAYKYKEGDKLIVECHAEHFLEPISSFIFFTQQDTNTISANVRNEVICMSNQENGIQLANGYKTNAIMCSISKGTLPGFPFIVEFKSKTNATFDIEMVMHEKSHGNFQKIPLKNGKRN